MNRIVILAVILAGLSWSAVGQNAAEFNSYYSGKRYDFRITQERLLASPPWLDSEPDPPLSARSAKEIAGVYLTHLFKNASEWNVSEIALHRTGERWVYLVSFDPPPPPGVSEWMSSPFRIVVLMDGTAVTQAKSSPGHLPSAHPSQDQ